MVVFMYSMSPNAAGRTTYPIVTSYFPTFELYFEACFEGPIIQTIETQSICLKGMFVAKGPIYWGLHVSVSLQWNLC